ncbi:MAG: glutathione S-transferase family protein, partial [Novosphingobium sp.]
MPDLALFYFPAACSHVTVCALEEAGLDYDLKLVNLAKMEQTGADYLKVNPLGKVPALLIDGDLLTENVAIIAYIDALKPAAKLLPSDGSPRGRAEAIRGLSFCSATLHPQVRGILNPHRLTEGEPEPVRAMSITLASKSFAYAEARIAEHGWWLGEWSIIDAYLQWALSVAVKGG